MSEPRRLFELARGLLLPLAALPLGAAFAVKGVLALVFAFARRPDEPPSFPTLRP